MARTLTLTLRRLVAFCKATAKADCEIVSDLYSSAGVNNQLVTTTSQLGPKPQLKHNLTNFLISKATHTRHQTSSNVP